MVNLRRQYLSVESDRRYSNRIEFHYPIVILGFNEKAKILDFSPDGFYIETRIQNKLAVGRQINLALKLPIDKEVLRLRAKVAYKDNNGIGVQVVDLTQKLYLALERCFNIFNSTLPID